MCSVLSNSTVRVQIVKAEVMVFSTPPRESKGGYVKGGAHIVVLRGLPSGVEEDSGSASGTGVVVGKDCLWNLLSGKHF